MKKHLRSLLAALGAGGLALLLGGAPAFADPAVGTPQFIAPMWYANTSGGGCSGIIAGTALPASPGTVIFKAATTVSLTSATTTQVVALAASKMLHVCGFTVSVSGITATVFPLVFESGTGALCATATNTLYQVLVPASGSAFISMGSGDSGLMDTSASSAFCIAAPTFSAGSIFVSVTYAQY